MATSYHSREVSATVPDLSVLCVGGSKEPAGQAFRPSQHLALPHHYLFSLTTGIKRTRNRDQAYNSGPYDNLRGVPGLRKSPRGIPRLDDADSPTK